MCACGEFLQLTVLINERKKYYLHFRAFFTDHSIKVESKFTTYIRYMTLFLWKYRVYDLYLKCGCLSEMFKIKHLGERVDDAGMDNQIYVNVIA